MFIWKPLVNNTTLPNQGRHADRKGGIFRKHAISLSRVQLHKSSLTFL